MSTFSNSERMRIGAGGPNQIESTISVSGINAKIESITVKIDIDHTYTEDLTVILFSPSGRGVTLVNRRGGAGENFRQTEFDDQAERFITNARPPFSGIYKPESQLSEFRGDNPQGEWKLRVVDSAYLDGGFLNEWSVTIHEQVATTSAYSINVEFVGGLSATQMAIFKNAAKRWQEVIQSELRLSIQAKGEAIDGPGGVLGRAGPTSVVPGTLFPNTGIMEFDSGDLAKMETDGSLFNVILHEMGHVIGIGTLWEYHGLLEGKGTSNPLFTGTNAMREYGDLIGQGPTKVPVANTGGPGTADSHWRERTFGNELMSGYADQGLMPLSRMSIAMLEDMGYLVNINAADPYVLPSNRVLAAWLAANEQKIHYHVTRPVCEGLPSF